MDKPRGLGFRDMKVAIRDLDLDAARAYVDSLPFFGTLSGTVAGSGQGKTLGRYGEAHYIAVSARDEIFVADTLNWRVQKYVKR